MSSTATWGGTTARSPGCSPPQGFGFRISRLAKILTAPGMWMQNFTTFEPDDSMIEVGIKALELVLPEEKGADAW